MSTMMAEGVGKRIVDALKMQSELEIVDKTQNNSFDNIQAEEVLTDDSAVDMSVAVEENEYSNSVSSIPSQQFQTQSLNFNSVNQMNFGIPQNVANETLMEVPQNVAILKQLIAQLPSGVSRQAGALVIKQTMEALGISMKSVLQEAQQMQENLNLSARDCQSSILECRKQISNLEHQVQSYQKQANSLNEIISLFVQIN